MKPAYGAAQDAKVVSTTPAMDIVSKLPIYLNIVSDVPIYLNIVSDVPIYLNMELQISH